MFTKYSHVGHTDANGMVRLSTLSGYDGVVNAWKEFDTDDGRKQWIDWKGWKAAVKLAGTSGVVKIEIRFEGWVRYGDDH